MQPIKKLLEALGVTLLAAGATPAAAQYGSAPPPPSVTPRGGAAPPAAPAAPLVAAAPAEVLRAAICVVGRDADAGHALLATIPFSPEERTQAGALARAAQRCLRLAAPLATTNYSFRGAVAEAVYESRFATPPAARAPALGAAPLPRPAAGTDAHTVEVLAPMYALVDCATPRQPALVRALLATEPRSPEETAALAALTPTFVACVPAGTQLRIDPRVMRNLFAEALYRWSVVQRDGPPSPWAAAAAAAAPAPQ
ncbi:MAG: hypothetical protein QOD42_3330 [Sphingomonadales bacterium]|jgi:hypothetical protein|nr:hypothetical protein [Sphingomonadales bacterium]